MRIALHQLNCVVGDLSGNERAIIDGIGAAKAAGAQLVAFPELAVTGYPPEDLLLKEHLLEQARHTIERIAQHADGIVALVGFPERNDDVYNALAVLADSGVAGVYRKMRLPNYGVFDEVRYFGTGERPAIIEVDGTTVGLSVCEDVWVPGPPITDAALAGASVIVNVSASPFQRGKAEEREQMLRQRARDNLCAVAFCGMVGGQDELVFDGASALIDHEGEVVARSAQFTEDLLIADIDPRAALAARLRDTRPRLARRSAQTPGPVLLGSFITSAPRRDEPDAPAGPLHALYTGAEEVYEALVLGTRDYVDKNGFKRVVLGLSGGVDSALVACVAVDALGPERVVTVVMPSPYSSADTQQDARALAANLGTELIEVPIEGAMDVYAELLGAQFEGHPHDLTEENLQARIRGNLLMALSNKFGWLVLTTGNKSELSVGYTTLYGDSAGGFAVIKDCPKTLVYDLIDVRRRRDSADPMPDAIVTRAPSAELRPDQRDEDSLPPYDVLDRILQGYVEDDLGRDQLVARGLPASEVERVIAMVDRAEYKRRQYPPGIKVTSKAFGRDRRVPITNHFGG
ncbi:MAG TPA: NAD+ synthase [Baekduia sp.]|nr:NAD+ synthase [Baekduia sp.]